MRVQRWSPLVALVAILLALAPLLPVAAAPPRHGIDPADMDLGVAPGTDFYRYANGGWLDRAVIPPDFASIETMSELDGRTRGRLIHLLQARALNGAARPDSDEWKAIRLFQQGTDQATRDTLGVAPIRPILARIDAIDDLAGLHRFLEGSVFDSVPGFFFVGAAPDLTDSATTAAYLNGPALGMPGRDFYLATDPATARVRDAYVAAGAALLTAAGEDATAAQADARAALALETALAAPTLTPKEAQNVALINNPATPAQLAARYPLMDWPRYLAGLGLGDVDRLLVVEPRYLDALDGIVRSTPLPTVKAYLRLQLLWSASANLSAPLESAAFAFYGTTLGGQQTLAPIEGRTLDQVNHFLGDAVGKLYVAADFSPEARAQSAELVDEVVAAYRLRLERNPWMTAATKANALAKLDKLTVKVGYPDHWRDYGDVVIGDSYFASALSAFDAWYREQLSKVGKPTDRGEWPAPPQTVNAGYNPQTNEIVVPAGILQPPFFDPAADPAANFGAIGYVIGHEITHGFDLQGSQFDAQGNLADRWSDQDRARFEALNDRVAAQYGKIEPLPGVPIDGRRTVTENVADLGGIQVAYDALELRLARHGRPLPPPPFTAAAAESPHLTQEQTFFVAAATVWRAKERDEALRTQLMADVHAPAAVRGTQPLRNCDAFYAAFAIGPGDPMYLPPDQRIVVW